MSQTTELEPARIEELLTAYRDLQSQFDTVRERLRRAEDHRDSVQRRIYDRVRSDYDRELDAIRARLTPLRDEIDRMNEGLEAQSRDAGSALQAVEEEISEAEFRHRIGEFPPATFDEMRRALDERAAAARSRRASLQSTLDAIATIRSPELSETSADAEITPTAPDIEIESDHGITHDASPEPAPVSNPRDTTSQRPTLAASNHAEPMEGFNRFENPQQWVSEMAPDPTRSERRARLNVPATPPKPAPRDEIDSVLEPLAPHAAPPGLPSLVFVSGPHAGQAIALLPTTLTIGREHDNNVEIKDPEVARYHARILRDRGDFVVEDLNSSTGTWVNGERTARAVLSHGDVIRVGQTELALDFEWTTDSH